MNNSKLFEQLVPIVSVLVAWWGIPESKKQMNFLMRVKWTAVLGLAGLLTTTANAGVGLETFVMATAGQTSDNTFRQPDAVINNFGGFGTAVPFFAHDNPALLDVAGTYRLKSASPGTILSDAASVAGGGNSTFGSYNYTGSTSTTVRQGQFKSESQAVHTGNADNHTVNAAESYCISTETLRTVSSAVVNGTTGTMRIKMTIDGSMSVSGTGGFGMIFRYDYGTPRGGYPALDKRMLETFAYVYGNGYQIYGPHSSFGSFVTPPGMAYNIGPLNAQGQPSSITFGGMTDVYADVPMTFGLDTEFRMGLMTWTSNGNGNGVMDAMFGHTATMTGIQIFDNNNNEVKDFTLTSGSGTSYNAGGVVLSNSAAAPEPGSFALMACVPLLTAMVVRCPLAIIRYSKRNDTNGDKNA